MCGITKKRTQATHAIGLPTFCGFSNFAGVVLDFAPYRIFRLEGKMP
jgi:hypothetical protein